MNKIVSKLKRTFNSTSPLYIVLFILLLIYAIFIIYLLLWGILTSVKTPDDFRINVVGFPKGKWAFSNFSYVISKFYVDVVLDGGIPAKRYIEDMILNTILYSVGGAFISTIVPCIVAYAVSKFNYKFNAIIKGIVIVTMILPIVGSAPAEIDLLRKLHLYDSIVGNWIQKFHFLGMYFLVFLSAFKTIPKEYYEAAEIDGANEFKIMTRIVFPLVKTVFTTIMLIKFVEYWNDYQTPLLYLPTHPTLAYGVYSLSVTNINGMNNVPMRMAGCVILLVPILIIFISFRKKIMGNISLGGIKE